MGGAARRGRLCGAAPVRRRWRARARTMPEVDADGALERTADVQGTLASFADLLLPVRARARHALLCWWHARALSRRRVSGWSANTRAQPPGRGLFAPVARAAGCRATRPFWCRPHRPGVRSERAAAGVSRVALTAGGCRQSPARARLRRSVSSLCALSTQSTRARRPSSWSRRERWRCRCNGPSVRCAWKRPSRCAQLAPAPTQADRVHRVTDGAWRVHAVLRVCRRLARTSGRLAASSCVPDCGRHTRSAKGARPWRHSSH